MGTIIESEVDFNFSNQSFDEADKELEERVTLQKEIVEKLNNLSQDIINNLPNDDLKRKFNLLTEYHHDLQYETFWLGYINQYRNIKNYLENDFHQMVLNLIEKYKIPGAEEKINYSIEVAVFNLLVVGIMNGKKPKDLIDKYGKNKTYWSRVPDTEAGENFLNCHKFLRTMVDYDAEERMEAAKTFIQKYGNNETDFNKFYKFIIDFYEEEKEDVTIDKLFNEIRIKNKKDIADDRLNEGKQDWAIAIKMAREEGGEVGIGKAVEFLKLQGHSKETVEKMLKEAKKQ